MQVIDVSDQYLKDCYDEVIDILLCDRTTKKNIMWATNNYRAFGKGYEEKDQIKAKLLIRHGKRIVKPRIMKSKSEQKKRSKDMAEIFTPAWVCNKQINMIDNLKTGVKNAFNKETSKLTQVKIREENGDFKTISTQEYTNMVLGYGIKLKEGACSKPINDKYSNVYHIWQNQSGLDIVTSDIDLMRVNSEQEITDVYELKRSWITIEDWRPFKQDYNNLILLTKLFKNCNIDFYIVYNVFKKEEGYEELSKLKLFKVNYSENLEIECKGIVEVSNFLLG